MNHLNECDVIRVEMNSEGDVNGFFEMFFSDGKSVEGWSCDQGSFTNNETDEKVPDWMNSLLFDLWGMMSIDECDHPDYYTHRYNATFEPGKEFWEKTKEFKEVA